LTRRALLGAAGIGALAAVAGCNPFSSAPATITVTAATTTASLPPQTPTVLLGLLFTTRLHVMNLETAIAVDKRDAALLTLLLKDRQAHLAALEQEYARQFGTPPAAETAAPNTTAAQSDDPDEVIGRIRGDASTAQNKFTDALSGASRFQAQLYGSIAACVATHRMVLA
jgi:hypothetical protein